MPAYKTPQQFPGVSSLPRPVQFLIESAFPPDQIPAPGAAIKPTLGPGQELPGARDAVEMIKRLQGGLSKMPTSASRAPAPVTAQPSGFERFMDVGDSIEETAPWRGLNTIRSLMGF